MRKAQFGFDDQVGLARKIIIGKVKNQRATLKYFSKYHQATSLVSASQKLESFFERINTAENIAELHSIRRVLEEKIVTSTDKAFITRTNFNGRGQSFFIGHPQKEFVDWDEYQAL